MNKISGPSEELSNQLFELAYSYHKKGDLNKAFELYKKDIEINKTNLSSYLNIGTILEKGYDYENALKCYKTILHYSPDHAGALNNVANCYRAMQQYDKAFEHAYKYQVLYPEKAQANANLAICYKYLGRLDMAVQYVEKAMSIDPDYPEVRFGLGYSYLTLRRLEKESWELYESRWDMSGFHSSKLCTHIPEWQGQNLKGKTILVHYEQGFGDGIQFIRLLKLLKSRYQPKKIIYVVQPSLIDLFKQYPYIDEIVNCEQISDDITADFRIALMTLPLIMDYHYSDI